MRPLLLRSQDEILAEIKAEVGDPAGGGLWGNDKIYRAMNRAIARWAGKVVYPRIYNFSSGFTDGTYGYALPRYVRGAVDVEIKTSAFGNLNNLIGDNIFTGVTWAYIPATEVTPTGTGEAAELRFQAPPYTQSGRIRYWVENGRMPYATTQTKINGGISASATSVIVDISTGTLTMLGDIGWVRIGNEYIGYTDMTRTSTTTVTLLNLDRGLFGSAAATHADNDDIFWCVMADDDRLWEHLMMQSIALMHESLLHRATLQDRANHEKMVNYLQMESDRFWNKMGYVTARETSIQLDQLGIGRLPLY